MPYQLLMSRRAWALAAAGLVGLAALWALASPRQGVLTRLDPDAAFAIDLGRGSGRLGLDTVRLHHDGTASFVRHSPEASRSVYEGTTLKLSAASMARVLEAVDKNRLLELGRSFNAEGVADGTQWLLRVRQGGREKAVYFDNRFPDEVLAFAATLDGVFTEDGLGRAVWHPVAETEGGRVERELWASVE